MKTTRQVLLVEGKDQMRLTLQEPTTLGEIWVLLTCNGVRPSSVWLEDGFARVVYH